MADDEIQNAGAQAFDSRESDAHVESAIGDNLVVELTPAGRGAIAVIAAAGPAALACVAHYFRPAVRRSIFAVDTERLLFGQWGEGAGEEVVVCKRAVGTVEIHCHGGLAAVARILDHFRGEGFTEISWQEWIHRFEPDPLRGGARVALAQSLTTRTSLILLDQYQGALNGAVRNAITQLDNGEREAAAATLEKILRHREVGAHLSTPWRVVLTGPPNVGKSSLINALGGFERAIVSATPGTTRDVVTLRTAIEGWPVELADTAGLRPSDDALESAGIQLARDAAGSADVVLAVGDVRESDPFAWDSDQQHRGRKIRVLNKIDLIDRERVGESKGEYSQQAAGEPVATSAIRGAGIPELLKEIAAALVPNPPMRGAPVPFTSQQGAQLQHASDAIIAEELPTAKRLLQSLLAS